MGCGLAGIGSHVAVLVEIWSGVGAAEAAVGRGFGDSSCGNGPGRGETGSMSPPRRIVGVGYGYSHTVAAGGSRIGLGGSKLVDSHIAGAGAAAAVDGYRKSGERVSQLVDRRAASYMECLRYLRCTAAAMAVAAADVDGVGVGYICYYEDDKTLSQRIEPRKCSALHQGFRRGSGMNSDSLSAVDVTT